MVNNQSHYDLLSLLDDYMEDAYDLEGGLNEYNEMYGDDFTARDWTEEFENVYGFYPDEDDVRIQSYIEDFKNSWNL